MRDELRIDEGDEYVAQKVIQRGVVNGDVGSVRSAVDLLYRAQFDDYLLLKDQVRDYPGCFDDEICRLVDSLEDLAQKGRNLSWSYSL